MRFLSWFITLPIVLVVVTFALHNREAVTLNLWPFDLQLALPLSFMSLGMLFIGFVLGALLMSFSAMRLRMQKRSLQEKVEK